MTPNTNDNNNNNTNKRYGLKYHIPQNVAIWIITNILNKYNNNHATQSLSYHSSNNNNMTISSSSPCHMDFWIPKTKQSFLIIQQRNQNAQASSSLVTTKPTVSNTIEILRNRIIQIISNPTLYPNGFNELKLPAIKLIASFMYECIVHDTSSTFITKKVANDHHYEYIKETYRDTTVSIQYYMKYNKPLLIQCIICNFYMDYPMNQRPNQKFMTALYDNCIPAYIILPSTLQQIHQSILGMTNSTKTITTTTPTTTTTTLNTTKKRPLYTDISSTTTSTKTPNGMAMTTTTTSSSSTTTMNKQQPCHTNKNFWDQINQNHQQYMNLFTSTTTTDNSSSCSNSISSIGTTTQPSSKLQNGTNHNQKTTDCTTKNVTTNNNNSSTTIPPKQFNVTKTSMLSSASSAYKKQKSNHHNTISNTTTTTSSSTPITTFTKSATTTKSAIATAPAASTTITGTTITPSIPMYPYQFHYAYPQTMGGTIHPITMIPTPYTTTTSTWDTPNGTSTTNNNNNSMVPPTTATTTPATTTKPYGISSTVAEASAATSKQPYSWNHLTHNYNTKTTDISKTPKTTNGRASRTNSTTTTSSSTTTGIATTSKTPKAARQSVVSSSLSKHPNKTISSKSNSTTTTITPAAKAATTTFSAATTNSTNTTTAIVDHNKPQTYHEQYAVSQIKQMSLTQTQVHNIRTIEILNSFRKLYNNKRSKHNATTTTSKTATSATTTQGTVCIPPTIDEIIIDIINQRDIDQDAKQMDMARILSEQTRKEDAQRRRNILAMEWKTTVEQCTSIDVLLDTSDKRLYSKSWILQHPTIYQTLKVCITQEVTTMKLQLLSLLQLEKDAQKWYGHILPKAYFHNYLIERLVHAISLDEEFDTDFQTTISSSSIQTPIHDKKNTCHHLCIQLQKEIHMLKTGLYNLSEQLGNVPKLFRDAHDETLPTEQQQQQSTKKSIDHLDDTQNSMNNNPVDDHDTDNDSVVLVIPPNKINASPSTIKSKENDETIISSKNTLNNTTSIISDNHVKELSSEEIVKVIPCIELSSSPKKHINPNPMIIDLC